MSNNENKPDRNTLTNFEPKTIVILPAMRKGEHKVPYAKVLQRKKATVENKDDKGKKGKKKPAPAFKLTIEDCQVSNMFEYENSKPEYGILQAVVSAEPNSETGKAMWAWGKEMAECITDKCKPHAEALSMDEDHVIENPFYKDAKTGRISLWCSVSTKYARLENGKEADYGKYEVETTDGAAISLSKLKTIGYTGTADEIVFEVKGKDGKMRLAAKLYKGIMAKPFKNDHKSTADLREGAKLKHGAMTKEDLDMLAGASDDSESGEIDISSDDDSDEKDKKKSKKSKKAAEGKKKKEESSDESSGDKKKSKKAVEAKKKESSSEDSGDKKKSKKAVESKKKDSDESSGDKKSVKEKEKKKTESKSNSEEAKETKSKKADGDVKIIKKKFSPKVAIEGSDE